MNINKYPEIKKAIKKYHSYGGELEKLYSKIEKLNAKGVRDDKLSKKFDDLRKEMQLFKLNELPKIVFKNLNKDKPDILEKKTGKVYSWESFFRGSYDDIAKDEKKRMMLFGLALEVGPYKLK